MTRKQVYMVLVILYCLGIASGYPSTAWSQLTVTRTFVAHQITDRNTSGHVSVGQKWQPKISHSGNRAVFTAGDASVYVINFDGSGLTNVGSCNDGCHGLDISDDGLTVIFGSSYGTISIVNADGSDKRILVGLDNAISSIRISADGTRVFFHVPANASTLERGIYVIDSDGTNLRQIVGPAQIAALLGIPVNEASTDASAGQTLDVSDDNQRIIFGVAYAYYGVNFDGSNLHQIPPGVVYMTDRSALSGDGTRIVIACNETSMGDYRIYAIDWGGTDKTYLANAYDMSCQGAWGGPTSSARLSINRNGSEVLEGSRGWLYNTFTGAREQMGAQATRYGPPSPWSSLLGYAALNSSMNPFATMDDNLTRADGTFTRRVVYMALTSIDCVRTDAGLQAVLATIETDPTNFGNAPALVAPNIYPTIAQINDDVTFGTIAFAAQDTVINYASAAMLFEGLNQCYEFDLGVLDPSGAFYSCSFKVLNGKPGPRVIRFEADSHEHTAGSTCWMHATAIDVVPFAISDGSTPPGKVSLISPSGTITTTTPTYTWNPVAGAIWYRLVVYDPTGMKINEQYRAIDICTGSVCSVSPGIALAPGDGYWLVQASNNGGNGPLSDSLDFKLTLSPPQAATLISPSGTITTTTPTYNWNALSGATSYRLLVKDSTGTKIDQWYSAADAGCSSGTGTCSLTPATALAAGAGQWQIQTRNSYGDGPLSNSLSFTVNLLPTAATLISPSGAITTTTPTYTWNAVSNSTWYYLWVSDSTGDKIKQWFTAAQAGCGSGTGTCSVTPAVAVGGACKWWIQTWNSVGYGPWSDGMDFTTPAAVVAGKATLISPSGEIDTNTPTYTWNAVSNSTWYYLWINDSTGNKIKQWYTAEQAGCVSGIATCSITPNTALAAGSAKWWIQTYNANGYGPWSDGMAFSVTPPGLPGKATLISPSGAITTTTPTYTWNAVSNSTWYYLWVTDSTGDKIKQWYTAAETGCGSGTGTCQVSPSTALAQGACTWWVQTYGNGGYGPWSDGLPFNVGTGVYGIAWEIWDASAYKSISTGTLPQQGGTVHVPFGWVNGEASESLSADVTFTSQNLSNCQATDIAAYKIDMTATWTAKGCMICEETCASASSCPCNADDPSCIEKGCWTSYDQASTSGTSSWNWCVVDTYAAKHGGSITFSGKGIHIYLFFKLNTQ